MQRENYQQQHADVEVGQGEADQREHPTEPVGRGIALHGCQCAEWDADNDTDQRRSEGEADGVRQALRQERVDGATVRHRVSEIQCQCVPHEGNILHPQRLIQSQLCAERFDRIRGGEFAESCDRRIARHDAQGEEYQGEHKEHRRHDLKYTAENVTRHSSTGCRQTAGLVRHGLCALASGNVPI